MRIIIFANGDFVPNSYTHTALQQAELIIAADNGARYCIDHGILPDVLIGDLDSLSPHILQELETAETEIIRHPTEKDATDLELALDYAVAKKATQVTILGGLGGRWDMSLANIFLLSHPKYTQLAIMIIGYDHLLYIANPANPAKLTGRAGDTISLLPLTPIVEGVETNNLRYPLQKEELIAASTRGISNQLMTDEALVTLDAGVLLCVHQLNEDEEISIAYEF